MHGVAKIEILRKTDETFDALLDVLTAALTSEGKRQEPEQAVLSPAHFELIDAVAARVIERLQDRAALANPLAALGEPSTDGKESHAD